MPDKWNTYYYDPIHLPLTLFFSIFLVKKLHKFITNIERKILHTEKNVMLLSMVW